MNTSFTYGETKNYVGKMHKTNIAHCKIRKKYDNSKIIICYLNR